MATFDYSEIADEAAEVIAEFGRAATLIYRSRTYADPEKPWRGNDRSDIETPCTSVVVPIRERQQLPALAIERGATSVAYVAATPHEGLKLEEYNDLDVEADDGSVNRWRIVDVRLISPDGTRLLYAFFLVR